MSVQMQESGIHSQRQLNKKGRPSCEGGPRNREPYHGNVKKRNHNEGQDRVLLTSREILVFGGGGSVLLLDRLFRTIIKLVNLWRTATSTLYCRRGDGFNGVATTSSYSVYGVGRAGCFATLRYGNEARGLTGHRCWVIGKKQSHLCSRACQPRNKRASSKLQCATNGALN
ncbi:hypothetical protein NC653_030976 [Populus alba x Populus x berolinensis]|uniref:Uncharacterized protein n=1 Tax=Populus alba x Populus x berolinensis TaxID=444605 RepID=A0AAD6Q2S3_9ROSI|nr:hypothetical protein NC653_030976 [Populus alba x Populus x berolinensis]